MISNNYRVGIYLRLSREDERLGESGSISTQRDLILNYIKENNLILVGEYIDDGVSGTTFDRVGFNQMIKDCEDKKINMIITKDTSRLGRDHIEFGFYVERYFPEHGIRYVAINDGVDTAYNSSGNDMLVFKSAFNDMYVKDISNKLRSSLYIKKKNGKFVGAYAPYGYYKDKLDKNRLLVDKDASFIVKRIFNMFTNGYSVTNICNILTSEKIPTPSIYKNMTIGQANYHYGVWSARTVSDILKNPTYMGNLTQGRQKKINYKSKKRVHNREEDWIISNDSVPAIIDKNLFELVSNMYKSNKNRTKKNVITDSLLLRGLIFCRECGHTIGFRTCIQNTKKYGKVTRIYGNCNYWAKRKKQGICSPHSVKYKDIEDVVLIEIRDMFKKYIDRNHIINIINNSSFIKLKKNKIISDISRFENNIKLLNKKIEDCYNDKLEGNITIDVYKRVYNNFLIEIENSKNSIIEYKKKLDFLGNDFFNDRLYMDKVEYLLDLNNHPSKKLISCLIDKIEIDENNNMNIFYKFSK